MATALPFFLWSPRDFVDDVVLFHLRQPFRADALSIPAAIAKATGWRAPDVVALAAAGAATALTWRRVATTSLATVPLAAAALYMAFFLFAKQAFCNYYYFVGALVLGGAALLEARALTSQGIVGAPFAPYPFLRRRAVSASRGACPRESGEQP
jgi:hypothetical protein